MELISVIIPAYRAAEHLPRAVASVLAQDYPRVEVIVIADDGADYAPLLAQHGLQRAQVKHLSTGGVGRGAPFARNVGIDAASGRLIALLDADDAFKPDKLSRCAPHALAHGAVSCGLEIWQGGKPVRTVGADAKGILPASRYKRTNISMDTMLVYDREALPVRFEYPFPCLEDLEFLLQIFTRFPSLYHLPQPLHEYHKRPGSISNAADSHAKYRTQKQIILNRITEKYYAFRDPDAAQAITDFMNASLKAEDALEVALAQNPNALFEDVMEDVLNARSE